MTKRMRTVGRLAMVAGLALLLTGCLKLDMDLRIQTDDTVNGSIVFAVDKAVLDLTGGSADDLLEGETPFPTDTAGVTTKDYAEGKWVGKEFSFDGVPIAEFTDSEDPEALKITHEGDTFAVSGVLDLAQGASGATGSTGAAAFFESAEIRVAITFPGKVLSSNGQASGNTVTWEPKFGERVEISATGSAIASGGSSSTLLYVLIGVGAVVLIAIIVFVMMSRRKKGPEAQVAAVEGTAVPPTTAPSASTEMPPPTTPEVMPPPADPQSGSGEGGGAMPPPPPSSGS